MIMTNEQKKNYLIQVFKFMREHPDLDHEATKRIIENILKSIDLSDQETRNSFKSFFILFKDIFDLNEEIVKAGVSLYFESFEAKLNIVRNALIKHIAKGLVKIKKLEIAVEDYYSINDIKLILETVKDTVQVLTIKNIQSTEQNKFSKILEKFLANNDVLVELTIWNVGLDSTKKMQNLADGLQHAKNLQILKIPHNDFGEAGAKILAKGLQGNELITSLEVNSNYIRFEGFKHLADALKENKTLISLNISFNYIRTEETNAFFNALSNLQYVETLDISSNNLTVQNIKELADFLKANKSVKTLNIAMNRTCFAGDAFDLFLEALEVNKTLTSLDIRETGLKTQDLDRLTKAIEKREVELQIHR